MICPVCKTDCADGYDSRFIEVRGMCIACDFERWLENRIKEIKGENNERDSVDDQADV